MINSLATQKKLSIRRKSQRNDTKEFICDDDDSDFENFSILHMSTKVDSRFGGTLSKEVGILDDDSSESFEPICDSVVSKIYPKTLPNLFNKMVIVVNHGKYRQEVSIEKCR